MATDVELVVTAVLKGMVFKVYVENKTDMTDDELNRRVRKNS